MNLLKQKREYKITGLCTIIFGIITHGMVLFNKYSYHDDASLFDIGATYQSGRWMLGVLGTLKNFFIGNGYYSIPLVNGLLSIIFIGIMACFIINLFDIHNSVLCVAISGIMVTFPTITGLFGYMFTAPYYMLGTLFTVIGVFLVCKFSKIYTFIIGMILTGCSIGVYQANIPIAISILLIYMIWYNLLVPTDWSGYFKQIFRSILFCVGFMGVYFIGNAYFLRITNLQLSDYRSINTMGVTSISGYIYRVYLAYTEFFNPIKSSSACMYPMGTLISYRFTLILIIILSVQAIYRAYKREPSNAVQLILLIIPFPLFINFIYVMCDFEDIYTLMVYSKVFIFIYLIVLINNLKTDKKRSYQGIRYIGIGLTFFLTFMYCRFANICYLKAELTQSQAISYFTTLITQIKSTEGYKDEYPVAIIGENNIVDLSISEYFEFYDINIKPYSGIKTYINDYRWDTFMYNWCGYKPKYIDSTRFENLAEVVRMPAYPEYGSIKIIDGTVVVKFSK